MHLTFTVNRGDLARLNLYVFLRAKSNWILMAIVAAFFTAWQIWKREPDSPMAVVVFVIGGLLVGVCGVGAGLVCSLFTVLTIDEKSGMLGEQNMTIGSEGIRIESTVSSGAVKWSAIRSLRNTSRYILFQLTSPMYALVPKSAFSSAVECDYFWAEANRFHRNAIAQ